MADKAKSFLAAIGELERSSRLQNLSIQSEAAGVDEK